MVLHFLLLTLNSYHFSIMISEVSNFSEMALLLLLLPLLVTASQRPLPPGFEEASWKKVGFKIVVDVKKFVKTKCLCHKIEV